MAAVMPRRSAVVRPLSICRTVTSVPDVRTTVRISRWPRMRLMLDITATPDPRSRTSVSPTTRTNLPSTTVSQQTDFGGSVSVCRESCNGAAERTRSSLPGWRDPSAGIGRCTTHAWDQIASAIVARRVRVERDMLASTRTICRTTACHSTASRLSPPDHRS